MVAMQVHGAAFMHTCVQYIAAVHAHRFDLHPWRLHVPASSQVRLAVFGAFAPRCGTLRLRHAAAPLAVWGRCSGPGCGVRSLLGSCMPSESPTA
jgi:hypothetical protein